MHKILVPLDGSSSASNAVRQVIALWKMGPDTEVHLLHVQPPLVPHGVPDIARAGLAGRLGSEDADHAFAAAKQLLEEAGARYSTRTETGDPPHEIALYAEVHGCTDIAMGTRGMGAIRNMLLGSVAMKVLHLVKIPVMLVK